MAKDRMAAPFGVGEMIVHSKHGTGKLIGIEEIDIFGKKNKVYVITYEKDKLVIRTPFTSPEAALLRRPTAGAGLAGILEVLTKKPRVIRRMWHHRAKVYQDKISSGNLGLIAELVRDLYRDRDDESIQSYSEVQIYEKALTLLLREVAASGGVNIEAAAKWLSSETGKTFMVPFFEQQERPLLSQAPLASPLDANRHDQAPRPIDRAPSVMEKLVAEGQYDALRPSEATARKPRQPSGPPQGIGNLGVATEATPAKPTQTRQRRGKTAESDRALVAPRRFVTKPSSRTPTKRRETVAETKTNEPPTPKLVSKSLVASKATPIDPPPQLSSEEVARAKQQLYEIEARIAAKKIKR